MSFQMTITFFENILPKTGLATLILMHYEGWGV